MYKEKDLRRVKADLAALRVSKTEEDELVHTLTNECTVLRAKVAAYQDKLKIADMIWLRYGYTLSAKEVELVASKEELAASKKELEHERARYAELMEELIGVGSKAMLKVRADLYHDGKSGERDVDRVIREYEEIASENELDN